VKQTSIRGYLAEHSTTNERPESTARAMRRNTSHDQWRRIHPRLTVRSTRVCGELGDVVSHVFKNLFEVQQNAPRRAPSYREVRGGGYTHVEAPTHSHCQMAVPTKHELVDGRSGSVERQRDGAALLRRELTLHKRPPDRTVRVHG
jgi:hypothetical protein